MRWADRAVIDFRGTSIGLRAKRARKWQTISKSMTNATTQLLTTLTYLISHHKLLFLLILEGVGKLEARGGTEEGCNGGEIMRRNEIERWNYCVVRNRRDSRPGILSISINPVRMKSVSRTSDTCCHVYRALLHNSLVLKTRMFFETIRTVLSTIAILSRPHHVATGNLKYGPKLKGIIKDDTNRKER